MAALFGKPQAKTFLILDIENGSVASALARFSRSEAPRLIGERRIELPLSPTLSSSMLARDTEKAVREALSHTAAIASRLRNAHSNLDVWGGVGQVAIFLGAPWGAPNLAQSKPDFVPGMQQFLRSELSSFAEAPLAFYTAAAPASYGAMSLYPEHSALILLLHGELLELLMVGGGRVEAYATVPWGYRSLLRTLQTHAGLTPAEARSALRLTHTHQEYEPLRAASAHVGANLRSTLEPLLAHASAAPEQVLIVSHTPAGEWLAHTLAEHERIADFFPQGGEVRSLQSVHLMPQAASQKDVMLMLEAMYLNR